MSESALILAYDSMGNPIVLRDANLNSITAEYNALGQKMEVNDPNMGIKKFTYTGFGEVATEQDANNNIYSYVYDQSGRLSQRLLNDTLEADFNFDTAAKGNTGATCKGLPLNEIKGSGYRRDYSYDNYCRSSAVITNIVVDKLLTVTGGKLFNVLPDSATQPVVNKFKKALKNGNEPSMKNDGDVSKIGDKSNEKTGIIYERTNPKTGECYIGQCKSPERFEKRKKEHNKEQGVEHKFKIVDRAEPGPKLDKAEHLKIQEKTQGMRAKDSNKVQNKKDPVGKARRGKMDLPEPKRKSKTKAKSPCPDNTKC